MKKITLLIGLPGSGKTTWINNNKIEENVFDDISQTDSKLEVFKQKISDNKDIIISDVCFCNKEVLFKAIERIRELSTEYIDFNFVLFKQNINECKENVKKRNDGRNVNSSIMVYSKTINETFNFIENNYPNKQITFKINKKSNKII